MQGNTGRAKKQHLSFPSFTSPLASLPLLLPGLALLVATAVAMEAFDEVSLPLPGQLAAIKQVG